MHDVIKQVIQKISSTNATHHAGALTYYTMMSLFPALLLGVALLSIFGQASLVGETTDWLASHGVEKSVIDSISQFLDNAISASGQTISIGFAIGLFFSLNAASGAFGAAGLALSLIRGDEDKRSFIKKRKDQLLGMLVMLILVFLTLLSMFVGGSFAKTIFEWIGLGDVALTIWNILRYFLALLVGSAAIGWIYAKAGTHRPWRIWSPGTALATIGWILVSLGFFFYVKNFGNYNATYGTFATAVVLLLWMYVSWLVILIGAILDNVLAPQPLEKLSLTLPEANASEIEPGASQGHETQIQETTETQEKSKAQPEKQNSNRKIWAFLPPVLLFWVWRKKKKS